MKRKRLIVAKTKAKLRAQQDVATQSNLKLKRLRVVRVYCCGQSKIKRNYSS